MRTSPFFVSLVVHAVMIAFAVVVPIVATNVFPRLRETTTFVAVTPEPPPTVPPPIARRSPRPASTVNPDAAPVAEPPALGPEQPVEPFDAPIAEGLLPGGDASAGLVDPFAIAPPPTPPAQVTPAAPRRVGGAVRAPQKIHHVAPEYPTIARSARVTGVVILEAIIGEDGAVRNVTVLRSIPLLDNAAVEAVRQWRFTPSLLNGEPISVIMTVTVSFNLN